MNRLAAFALAALFALPAQAADKIGIFELLLESSASFAETATALESAIESSPLQLHGTHDIRVPDDLHSARLYVLTSPEFVASAVGESPRTISAQVLRVAVYTQGDDQRTYVNMANPVAHAMVYYAQSSNRDALLAAAGAAADDLRQLVADIPGEPSRRQLKPMRSEKHYAKYKGDGPARMMAKFRNWRKSQLVIATDPADDFDSVVERVTSALSASTVGDAADASGWETVAVIPIGEDAVYVGLTNPFIENKMVRINSRFRSDRKTDDAPYPGVDHVTALPTDVLIVREGNQTHVMHSGQMWRMQLYFWDSGYRAFTANVGVPSKIANSIEDAVTGTP